MRAKVALFFGYAMQNLNFKKIISLTVGLASLDTKYFRNFAADMFWNRKKQKIKGADWPDAEWPSYIPKYHLDDFAAIDFEGHQHDALWDARNTAELFRIYRDEWRFNAVIGPLREAVNPKKQTSFTLADALGDALKGLNLPEA